MSTRAQREHKAQMKRNQDHLDFCQFLAKEIYPRLQLSRENPDHLLAPKHNIEKTGREIRDQYGLNCLHLHQLIFMLWVRGGRTTSGKSIKTQWKFNPVAAEVLSQWILEQKDREFTAKECVEYLQSVNVERLFGFRELRDGNFLPRMPVNAEERRSLIEEGQREIRDAWAQTIFNCRSKDEKEQVNAERH